MVCNDCGGPQLLISPGGSDRIANLVLVSCEAFDNYPPGFPGRLLCATAALPGGTFPNTQLIWVDDSRTLIPVEQPSVLTDHLQAFLAKYT